MADVSERILQVAILISFASGFLAGWQANRMRRKFLDWRKKRLQEKLAETQKKLDLSLSCPPTQSRSSATTVASGFETHVNEIGASLWKLKF
ncbi:hypothetical protein Z043_101934 [Scleropages formosus]|uniref:Mitoregulin n=2 Tax=Scleropages formosus TaxID=113540 RepID=A0A0N8K2S6_SCLFO|nr:hypothetical protein Z043_101934 [Scleropages formosus]